MTHTTHLDMEQLIAARDDDRSEPRFAEAHVHLATCQQCARELDRLHQRTARLRALPSMAPGRNQFPAVRFRYAAARRQHVRDRVAFGALAIAASLVVTVIGSDLVRPRTLDAQQQIDSAMTRSHQLEQTLREWKPEERVLTGRAAQVVIQLEDRIADLDAQLADEDAVARSEHLEQQLRLWQERVNLMNALVDVHVTRASNLDL